MIRMLDVIGALRGWRRSLAALATGAVAALGLPPLDFWPALVVAVPIMLRLLDGARGERPRVAFRLGWLIGLGYFLVALQWIGAAFFVDAATYLWMMPFAVGGLAAGMAVFWGLAGLATRLLRWRGLPQLIAFAVALALAENLRGRVFTGFPWAAPGLMADGMGPVVQIASLVGMTGLSLLVVLWAGLLVIATERRTRFLAVLLLLPLPLAVGLGAWRLATPAPPDVAGVRLRLVQPDISQDEKWREENARAIFDKLQALSADPTPQTPDGIAAITHVIWPESAVPFFIDESPVAKTELAQLLGGKTVLITGADRRIKTDNPDPYETPVFNSVVTFDGNATVVARYDKWRLVPGGEFLPFEWLLKPLGFRQVVTVPGSFTAGPGPRTIAVPGAPPAGMLVCYEVAFPHDLIDASQRPAWLVNVTNDGWFGNSTGPYQHLAQARLRAIEQGLPLVRAANTGISAVIDAYGRYRDRLPIGRAGVIDANLPGSLPPTLYARLGDWTLLAMALVLLAIGALISRGQRQSNST